MRYFHPNQSTVIGYSYFDLLVIKVFSIYSTDIQIVFAKGLPVRFFHFNVEDVWLWRAESELSPYIVGIVGVDKFEALTRTVSEIIWFGGLVLEGSKEVLSTVNPEYLKKFKELATIT